jgi:phenylpropionate dioxygenase-like ring-hydroxylating dioxygenase large terminal subunit
MPHTPNGWYGVLRSHELPKKKVLPLTVFDRQLVAFRGEDGVARVLHAFCPHLGAHLGHGGKVRGIELECPFHAWRFAGDGRCTHAPFAKRTPDVGVRAWKVIERTGLVYVWIHALGAEPTYEPPAVPHFEGLRGWGEARELRGRYRIHIQELRENRSTKRTSNISIAKRSHRSKRSKRMAPMPRCGRSCACSISSNPP